MLATSSVSRQGRAGRALFAVLATALLGSTLAATPDERVGAASVADRVLGPSECADCHTEEFEVWEASAHQAGSRDLARSDRAREIASALGIRRIKNAERCTTCHFTVAGIDPDDLDTVAGVSCESCHGASLDWIDVHNDFGGARGARDEDAAHREERLRRSVEHGMVRPSATDAIADRCFTCHTVADEELVAAGHPTGAAFELVSWSQGEMRHNFLRGGGESNALAPLEHRRHLYVLGQLTSLRHTVTALTACGGPGAYADDLCERVRRSLEALRAVHAATCDDSVASVLAAADGLELAPRVAADDLLDAVERALTTLQTSGAMRSCSKLDALLPADTSFVGRPAR
ncbi:MAG: cytochrome c family protein [Planctomycetota bacterium]